MSCSLLSKLQEPILCFSVPSFIFLPVHRTPPLSASSYHNFRFLQANSPPSVFFRKECRLSPFYFSEIALVAVFPLHLTGICGMIQDVFLFLFAAAMRKALPPGGRETGAIRILSFWKQKGHDTYGTHYENFRNVQSAGAEKHLPHR